MIGGGLELMRKDLVNSCNSLPGLLSAKGYSRKGPFGAAVFFTADESRFTLILYKSKWSI